MSVAARRLTVALVALHGLLLAWSLPDYFVSVDSGYHVSMGRWYGEHGTAWWDGISYGPGGRPNLQGPLLHAAIGYLGRALGGDGMDYVRANAVLALGQWVAAIFTVWFFARRVSGDWAALYAVALFSGTLYSSLSFAVGIPSGWVFVFSAWAAWFFVEQRLGLTVLLTAAAIYTHLAGYAMAPVAVLVAAVLTRRWRALVVVGAATVVVTSPYTIHFLRHLDWYRGQRGDEALLLAPLTYLPAAVGSWRLLREPRKNVFLVAWLAAPAAWILQDYKRFLLQAPLVLAVIAGIEVARQMERLGLRWRQLAGGALVVLATVFPLTTPAVAFEVMWSMGLRNMRFVDWAERKQLAEVVEKAGLRGRLVQPWNTTEGISMAVFVPMQFEGGHWVEVQPKVDPVRNLSAGVKVYALPVPAKDEVLGELAGLGWLTVHGGTELNSIVTLTGAAGLGKAARALGRIGSTEGAWLAANAVNNRMPEVDELLSVEAGERMRARTREQRKRVGRIETALQVYAYALEKEHGEAAQRVRGTARRVGDMANRLGDEGARGMRSERVHRQLRENLAGWAQAVRTLEGLPGPELERATEKMLEEYFR